MLVWRCRITQFSTPAGSVRVRRTLHFQNSGFLDYRLLIVHMGLMTCVRHVAHLHCLHAAISVRSSFYSHVSRHAYRRPSKMHRKREAESANTWLRDLNTCTAAKLARHWREMWEVNTGSPSSLTKFMLQASQLPVWPCSSNWIMTNATCLQ